MLKIQRQINPEAERIADKLIMENINQKFLSTRDIDFIKALLVQAALLGMKKAAK